MNHALYVAFPVEMTEVERARVSWWPSRSRRKFESCKINVR